MNRHSFRRAISVAATFVVLLLAGTPASSAQGFNPERMKARMTAQVDETIKTLALEGETADTVRTILMDRVEKRFTLMGAGRGQGDRGAMREAMQKLDDETTGRLAEVLTEEQLAAWKKHEEAQRAAMGRRRPGG